MCFFGFPIIQITLLTIFKTDTMVNYKVKILQEISLLQKMDPEIRKKIVILLKKCGYSELTPLQEKVIPPAFQNKNIIVQTEKHSGQTLSYALPIMLQTDFSYSGLKIIIIASSVQNIKSISNQFRKLFVKKLTSLQTITIGTEKNIKKEFRLLQKQPDIIIGTAERFIDHIRRNNLILDGLQTAVIEETEITDYEGFEKDLEFILSKMTAAPRLFAFTEVKSRTEMLSQLIKKAVIITKDEWKQTEGTKEEKIDMKVDENEEKYEGLFKNIIKEIKEESDPVELSRLNKIIKKNVPFFLRKYLTAYLFSTYMNSAGSIKTEAGNTKTLFLNTGKNKGLYSGELIKIIKTASDINKDKIKQIRILDNYSFIEVSDDAADILIEKLSDWNFRGRRLSISHARNNRRSGTAEKKPFKNRNR